MMQYNDGCEFYERKKVPIKFLLDLGYLEGECGFCVRKENCFIQDIKTKEVEQKNKGS